MMTMWKQAVPILDEFTIDLPRGAIIRALQMQDGIPCIWFQCDPDKQGVETRRLRYYGTGHHDILHDSVYIGTIQYGALVFHLFEAPRS